jgi:hypothetical protein
MCSGAQATTTVGEAGFPQGFSTSTMRWQPDDVICDVCEEELDLLQAKTPVRPEPRVVG